MIKNNLKPFKMCVLQNFPFIEADFDALTNYELMCKIVEYLNKVIESQNDVSADFQQLASQFNALKKYVDEYFKTTDFAELVNNKLDEMAEDGTLAEIINMEIFNEKVDKFNQESSLNRIYRIITSTYNNVNAIHVFDDAIYMSINHSTKSMLYKLNKNTFEVISNVQLNYVSTDISDYNDKIIIVYGTNVIKTYDKNTLDFIGNIGSSTNIKYCEKNGDSYIIVNDENKFKTTTDFVSISDYNLQLNCNGIAIKNSELYVLTDNALTLYDGNKIKRIYNQELIVNNGFIKGISKAIATDNERFIVGTFKKLIPIREDYSISLYEMNLSTNIKAISKLLNYNSTRNEFEIYYDSTNTSVNPDGSSTNGFSNFYECIEVALNGNYNKGNIMFKNENEVIDDLFVSDVYKKIGLYFNGATINGALFRNSAKIEVNNCTFTDEYLTNQYVVGVVGTDMVFADSVTFANSKSLTNVLEATYKSMIALLSPITTGHVLSRTGSVIITRNNSLYDKKTLGDRFSKFMPNVVALSPTNINPGTTVTIDDLTLYTRLLLRVNFQAQFSFVEIPALDGTYTVTSCIDYNNKMYLGTLKITISGTSFTIESKMIRNLTDNTLDNSLTYRINNIFGTC